MAATPALDDIGHQWGEDLRLGPTGDLARVNLGTRSTERVLRRLMTNQRAYFWHPLYGGGLPEKIGEAVDLAKARTLIRGQMFLERSVARTPAPVIEVRELALGGLQADVQYTALPDKQPVSLSFKLGD